MSAVTASAPRTPLSDFQRADRGGKVKQALIKAGFPAEDVAGYATGEALDATLRSLTKRGEPFALRDYQRDAVHAFHADGTDRGGSGVIVLPCGAGKTIVGMGAIAAVQASTLILTTSVTAVRQWIAELIDKRLRAGGVFLDSSSMGIPRSASRRSRSSRRGWVDEDFPPEEMNGRGTGMTCPSAKLVVYWLRVALACGRPFLRWCAHA